MHPVPHASRTVPAPAADAPAGGIARPAAGKAGLDALRRKVARLERDAGGLTHAGLPLDLAALEGHLPDAVLAGGALHEVMPAAPGDLAAAFGFAVALLARAQAVRRGPLVLVTPRRAFPGGAMPYGHGLAHMGLDVARLVLVRTDDRRRDDDTLWAIEETTRAAVAGMAVAGIVRGALDLTASRRLSLAAAAAGIPLLLLRAQATTPTTAAATRWRIAAAPAARDRFDTLAFWRWDVALQRSRRGRAGRWIIEWDHDTHRFRMAEVVADRAPAARADGFRHAG